MYLWYGSLYEHIGNGVKNIKTGNDAKYLGPIFTIRRAEQQFYIHVNLCVRNALVQGIFYPILSNLWEEGGNVTGLPVIDIIDTLFLKEKTNINEGTRNIVGRPQRVPPDSIS